MLGFLIYLLMLYFMHLYVHTTQMWYYVSILSNTKSPKTSNIFLSILVHTTIWTVSILHLISYQILILMYLGPSDGDL